MNFRVLMLVSAPLLGPGAFAADEPNSPPTEQTSPEPSGDINRRVQEKLRERGFYAGPINGDIGPNTQAALAQFQLSVPIPASGQLDELTVAALGVERDATTPGGVSQDSAAGAMPAQPADKSGASASAGSSSNVEPTSPSGREAGDRPAAEGDRAAQRPALRGTCDALVGPEKDRCLQQGGTIETGAKSSSGATAPSDSK